MEEHCQILNSSFLGHELLELSLLLLIRCNPWCFVSMIFWAAPTPFPWCSAVHDNVCQGKFVIVPCYMAKPFELLYIVWHFTLDQPMTSRSVRKKARLCSLDWYETKILKCMFLHMHIYASLCIFMHIYAYLHTIIMRQMIIQLLFTRYCCRSHAVS